MIELFLIRLSEWTLMCAVGLGLATVVLANMYDLHAASRRQRLRAIERKLRLPRQPQVTVLIYVEDEKTTIEKCLRSIGKSRYKKYDIVVVDNASKSTAKREIMRYRKRHPRMSLYLYKKMRSTNRTEALREGYRKSSKGDIVLVLDGNDTIEPTTLKAMAARFEDQSRVGILRLHIQDGSALGIASMLARFSQLSYHMTTKSLSFLSLYHTAEMVSATAYRKAAFLESSQGARRRAEYVSSLVVMGRRPTAKPRTDRGAHAYRLVTIGVMLLCCYVAVLISFFIYTAASLQSSSLLMLSWLMISLWFVAVVWSDEKLKLKEKIALFFCIPPVYFLVYIHALALPVTALSQKFIRRLPKKSGPYIRTTA